MNNNNLGRVAVRTSSRKRVPTPLAHDVNATHSVGEIVPYMVRECLPKSKFSLKTRNLIRLATMVVPTYGRLKLNLRHYFVGMSDLTENFAALLSEKPIARGALTFRPMEVPKMPKGLLSLFSLVGAHVTLYRHYSNNTDSNDDSAATIYKLPYVHPNGVFNASSSPYSTIINWFGTSKAYQNITPAGASMTYDELNQGDLYRDTMPAGWQNAWDGYTGPALNIAKLIYSSSWVPTGTPQIHFWIPIENKSWDTLFDYVDRTLPPDYSYYDVSAVPLDTADAVISIRQKGVTQTDGAGFLAVRFSDFGKRWYNLLISSGIGVDYADFTSVGEKSLMPLFAYYKAYWESFGLELYKNWETSDVARMLRFYDDYNESDFEKCVIQSARYSEGDSVPIGDIPYNFFEFFTRFVTQVCTAFYTEEQDFVSAHTRDATVSPNNNGAMVNAWGVPYGNSPSNSSTAVATSLVSDLPHSGVPSDSGSVYIPANTPFSQLDIETLKRLYKVVNRNTIAGSNIAKLLEVQGLGDYVRSCKSRFLGSFDVPIDIDEVTATSDFFDSNGDPRSLLGEQGGKGIGFGSSKSFSVSPNEYGYYIVLASIVPESGYVNVASASGAHLRKAHFYNPEYDGLGMELNPKEMTVSGVQDWSDQNDPKLSESSFGFAPRYSREKVQSNVALGGFAMRSLRSYYRSFFVDKLIDVGERRVVKGNSTTYSQVYYVHKLGKVSLLPIASPEWRFIGRYPWLENYLRIFAETGDPRRNNFNFYRGVVDFENATFDFTFRDDPKFIVQNRMVLSGSVPWLKITDSYETKENGNVGSSDVSIGKE